MDAHKRVSWQYVAGFFDGEGSISPDGGGRQRMSTGLQVGMSQKLPEVLHEIRLFLLERGIKSTIYTKSNATQVSDLKVNGRDSIARFLDGIRPWVIAKKLVVEDAIRHFKLYPKMPGAALAWENRGNFRNGIRVAP